MDINTFVSYVGEAPATVEWVLLDGQPTVTAVVLTVPRDRSLNLLLDLSAECIARFTVLARESHKARQRAEAEQRVAGMRLDLRTGDIGLVGGAA